LTEIQESVRVKECLSLFTIAHQVFHVNAREYKSGFPPTPWFYSELPSPFAVMETFKKRRKREKEYPRITYDAATRTFDRLFKGITLTFNGSKGLTKF